MNKWIQERVVSVTDGVKDEKMIDEKRYTGESVKCDKVADEQMDTAEGVKCNSHKP